MDGDGSEEAEVWGCNASCGTLWETAQWVSEGLQGYRM